MEPRLVLLDFDGTLTKKDTLFEFIRFHHGTARYAAGFLLLSPMLVLFKAGLISNDKAKEIVLRYFFGNTPLDVFDTSCASFARDIIPSLIRENALNLIRQEKAGNATISVVSASPENWVKPWCDVQGIRCIATHLEVIEKKITGNIEGRNCHGPEKVRRIEEVYSLSSFRKIVAYGDSSGDREMLAIANEPHWREL